MGKTALKASWASTLVGGRSSLVGSQSLLVAASLLWMGILAGLGTAVAADGAGGKVAIVDIERAIKSTSAGQKMNKELQAEFERKKKEFQKREGDLRKKFEDLEKKKGLLTEDARNKKAQELAQDNAKFQQEVKESQETLQKKQSDLLEPIAKQMEEIIDKMAKEGSYSAILDRRAILWGAKESDITEQVVKEFEKTAKK